MKELNPLEAELRSWTPRRPSLKVKRRLFTASDWRPSFPKLAGVLAPTAACLVLTLVGLLQSGETRLRPGQTQSAAVALSLSNQNFAPYLPGNQQSIANRWDTFEWTNRGSSQSSVRSFTPPKATDLR